MQCKPRQHCTVGGYSAGSYAHRLTWRYFSSLPRKRDRVKRQYGLIGFPLSHSFSHQYFTNKFRDEGMDNCEFINFELQSIAAFTQLLDQHPYLKGLAVTIPHKQSIIRYLKQADDVVRSVNACNCIKLLNGDLHGYNTDVTGFERSFTPLLRPHQTKALVLGRGGAAMAVSFVLDHLSIEHRFVERNPGDMKSIAYAEVSGTMVRDHHIIINTTPLGMFPQTDTFPMIPY